MCFPATYVLREIDPDSLGKGAVRLLPVISCSIMAHPERSENAKILRAKLGRFSAEIVYDPCPGGSGSTLRTAVAAWSAMPDGATHHLLLQDDVELCEDFSDRLCALVELHPEKALSLFAEWGSSSSTMIRWGAMAGAGIVECADTYVPAQAVLLPADDVRGFAAHAREYGAWEVPDDIALRRFLGIRGRSSYAAVPNLVQHHAGGSLLGHDYQGLRRSTCLADRHDPLPEQGVLPAPVEIPVFTWGKGRAMCLAYRPAVPQVDGLVPTRRLLERRGYDRAALNASLDEGLDRVMPLADLELKIGYALMHELWTTAVALGALAPPGDRGTVGPLDAPLVRRSLDTMAAGALRSLVDAETLLGCAAALERFVFDGVAHGLTLRPPPERTR
jgi:hypothetical protein